MLLWKGVNNRHSRCNKAAALGSMVKAKRVRALYFRLSLGVVRVDLMTHFAGASALT